jgi:hypothetical protein
MRWRAGKVVDVIGGWPGAVELVVDVIDAPPGAPPRVRALAYPELVGCPEVGDTVLLNTTALELELGTGGYAMVVALPDRIPTDPPEVGHLVKARYLPLQTSVLGADEPDSPYFELLRDADSLDGMPVVVADLHSSLPAILAGLLHDRPGTRVVYVMTDGGALPVWFSRTVSRLREASWLAATVTVGQAFGGDGEAVSLHSGLLAAHLALGAEVAIVTQGPGNLGTGTRWGFSGVTAGEAVNAAAILGGRAVAALRISGADPRRRHLGVSHHSLTAYGRVALTAADVPVPDLLTVAPELTNLADRIAADVAPLAERHRLVEVDCTGLLEALRQVPGGLSTMGRGLDSDPAYFLAAAAAGRHAATLLSC